MNSMDIFIDKNHTPRSVFFYDNFASISDEYYIDKDYLMHSNTPYQCVTKI